MLMNGSIEEEGLKLQTLTTRTSFSSMYFPLLICLSYTLGLTFIYAYTSDTALDWRSIMSKPSLRRRRLEYFRLWFSEWSVSGRCHEDLFEWMTQTGIKVIACDFDLTMTSVHSGGYVFPGSELANSVLSSLSSEFQLFASFASSRDFRLACVTFADSNTCTGGIGGNQLVSQTNELL